MNNGTACRVLLGVTVVQEVIQGKILRGTTFVIGLTDIFKQSVLAELKHSIKSAFQQQ